MHRELDEKVELAWLSSFYGPLLTDAQREKLSQYCEEDLSVTEIAAMEGVSRQAIHEMISRSGEKMRAMEAKLHLAKRFSDMEMELVRCANALKAGDTTQALELINTMIARETSMDQEEST